jgi:Zn-dependent protease with chaperone function
MIKALFFIKRGQDTDDIELTPDEEPQLFEFLNQLADEAGAPRPHRVFISPRVNACVFYDLSILNFLFPSRKNLEIGLGLVNVLNIGEFKAVLAHEFGHFAQKSMAVGSWVYIAHQIAAHIIAQRDIFDRFIQGLSRFDLRIAWIGWILGLIVWSIRSLMDTVFSIVIIAQRALSREMEFQADLVAVSLTGSDALIHALHKLHAADEAWDRALGFVSAEANEGRAVSDVFKIQTRVIEKLGVILNDPSYGQIPALPETDAQNHRLFKTALASPPKMWSTHPENSAREENAKQHYVPAVIDAREAWSVFQNKGETCARMSSSLLDASELSKVDTEETVANLDKQYNKAYYFKLFQGAYLGRSITRYAKNVTELYGDYTGIQDIDAELAKLYPNSLTGDLGKVKSLYEEKYTLEGIQAKTLHVSGGIIRHRNKTIKRKDLPKTIQNVKSELLQAEKVLQDHDIRCRTAHLNLAHRAGKGWEENLLGLLSLLHYADHGEANLRDIHAYVSNVVRVIMADGRVTKKELAKLLTAVNEAHTVLAEVYEKADEVRLGSLIKKQLEVPDWKTGLGSFELPPATKENINEWMSVFDGWVGSTINALSALSTSALEQLLKVESYLSKQHRNNAEPSQAPTPPVAPTNYLTLVEGQERELKEKLSLWDRFYTADGLIPASFRFTVAASIVGAVVFVGNFTGSASVTIYNGLANTVNVSVSGKNVNVNPFSSRIMDLPYGSTQVVSTKINNQVVETFDIETSGGFGDYIYNVAQASPMIEWTQVYGNAKERPDRTLGAKRWFSTSAGVIFKEPPESVKTKNGGATREVLSAVSDITPRNQLSYVDNIKDQQAMIHHHIVWDSPSSAFLSYWLGLVDSREDLAALMEERLSHYQQDIIAMRLMQDYAADESTYNAICEDHRMLAAANTDNSNLQYLATRCISDDKHKDQAFIQGATTWPDNSWFNMAAAYTLIEQGKLAGADKALAKAIARNSGFKEGLALDAIRLKRFLGDASTQSIQTLARNSTAATRMMRLESGEELGDTPYRFYSLLNKGDLKSATTAARKMDDQVARSLRLVAASDGASSTLIKEAQKFGPEMGIDQSTVWVAWSLEARTQRNPRPYEDLTTDLHKNAAATLAILKKVKRKGAYQGFEKDLIGMGLEERGYTYAAACVLLGNKAPTQWRNNAKQLLFATERPYFR